MFFTKEDYEKIEKYLKQNSKKDTDFERASLLTGNESIAIVQNGENRLIDLNTLGEYINGHTPIIVNPGYTVTTDYPTVESLARQVDPSAPKPTTGVELDMSALTGPEMCYLTYPLSWEVIQDEMLVVPYIVDSNGFTIGCVPGETLNVNGGTFRVTSTLLGTGLYTVYFNK